MRALLLVFGVCFALFGALGTPHARAGGEAAHAEAPCCCDDAGDDGDAHCCEFDGGRCCVSAGALPPTPIGRAIGPAPASEADLQPISDAHDCPRAVGPPPTPPPIR